MDDLFKQGQEIIIDYLSVTFEFRSNDSDLELEVVDNTVEMVRGFLNVKEERIIEKEFGKGNYRYMYEMGDGVTLKLCGPLNERGMHTNSLEMKGEGCREFERNNDVSKWPELFMYLLGFLNGRCSRIDLTIDDYSGDIITFDYIKDKLDRGMYISEFRKSYTLHGNKEDGYSITFGARKANNKTSKQLCIYEKNKEQISKGKECSYSYWTRYEMRFMHEKAAKIAEAVFFSFDGEIRYPELQKIPKGDDGFKFLVSTLLYSMLDIKEENEYDESNKTKAKTDEAWLTFVGNVKKANLSSVIPKEPSFNRYNKYVHQTLGLYLLFTFITSDCNINQFNKHMLQELRDELIKIFENDKKINQINKFLIESGLNTISKKELNNIIDKLNDYLEMEDLPL